MGSEEIWFEALRTLEADKRFALATVVNVRGSTPREVGAKMIVRDDGQFGTIGGGCGEAEVFRKARLLLEEGRGARIAEVDLTGDFDQEQIGTCGGLMDVFIDVWQPRDQRLARKLAESAAHSRPAALITLVDAGSRTDVAVGAKTVIDPEEHPRAGVLQLLTPGALSEISERVRDASAALMEINDAGGVQPVVRIHPSGLARIFVDPITGTQRLIIAGGGHIAIPLARLGSMLGLHVTVIDDRGSFANRDRFPSADEIIARPFTEAIEGLRLDKHCFVISVTRGHAFDEQVLRAALKKANGAFIGMIGSRRRVHATLNRLEGDGFDRKLLEEVHAPLGLDIGAETPEEIAVAIIAEVIRERRTGVRDDVTLGTKSGRLRRVAPSHP